MNINLNIIIISILGILSIVDNNYLQQLFNYKIITIIYLLGLCYVGKKQPLISLFMAILYLVVNNKQVTTENFQNSDETDDDDDDDADDDDEKTDEEEDDDDDEDKEDEDTDDDSDDVTEAFSNGRKQYRLDNNLRKLNNAIRNFDY